MSHVPQQAPLRVLVTGAAGRIGTAFVEAAQGRYQLRLADRRGNSFVGADYEPITMDIVDLDACQAVCEGIDVVVHLAGNPGSNDFDGVLLDSNIKGAYNIFRAAKDQGCRRVVYASSVQTVATYPLDTTITSDMPPNPPNMYAVSKCFGENLARYFAYVEGLSCIAVRIGAFEAPWILRSPDPVTPRQFVSKRDLCNLLIRCVETPDIPFAIVHGVSNNHPNRLDLEETHRLLGYKPQDEGLRWIAEQQPVGGL